jgi:hypothetical protein
MFAPCGKRGKRLREVAGQWGGTPGVLQKSAQTIDPGTVTEILFFKSAELIERMRFTFS